MYDGEYVCNTRSCYIVNTTYIVNEHNNYCISDKENEDIVDKLKSILTQLEYTHEIRKWQEAGVPFDIHFYVPECHPETGETFLEREDEAHVFKVFTSVHVHNVHVCAFV